MSLRLLPAVLVLGAAIVAVAVPAGYAQPASTSAPSTSPLLRVLRDTGGRRDNLPVYELHPDGGRFVTLLSRGLPGRLLRLYAMEQRYLQARKGKVPEPAYLLLSNREGGFPGFGFCLGSACNRETGYVDLRFRARATGYFGAMDQIFPHELAHVIVAQLAGPPMPGGSNQMHAIGVKTDRREAFSEGFAEHFQVMAIDDPDVLPETKALLREDYFKRRAERQFGEYGRELQARWPVPGRRRAAFPLWFAGGGEQTLRYYAVKANAFARAPRLAEHLLHSDPFSAYLLENTVPAAPTDPPRTPAQLVSIEGFVASLFVAWVSDAEIQQRYREPAFYEPFGVAPGRVSPLENAYLKLFHVLFVARPADVPAMLAGYKRCFPDEAAALDRVVRTIALGQSLDVPDPIWLANDDFRIGTSMFDQWRSMPRTHTFDLNAASEVDLVAVAGVDRRLAGAILKAGPYRTVGELQRVPGLTRPLLDRFTALERRAVAMRQNPADEEASLTLMGIMAPYLWRALALAALAGALGAVAYRLVVPQRWWRAVVNGVAAALVGFVLEAALELPMGLAAVVGPAVGFGVPAALYSFSFPSRLRRRLAAARPGGGVPGRARLACAMLVAWSLAAAPLALLITPLF
jgi:hypothetical protein